MPSDLATFKIPTPFASCCRTFRSVAVSIFGRPSFTPCATARLSYDHDYEGDLTIKMVDSLEELHALCKLDSPSLLACPMHNARSCMIIMVNDDVMRRRGYSTGLLLRHERGHCNGWGADHAGQRPLLLGSTHWAPADQRVRLPLEWLQEAVTIRAKSK
jgi:hypothetical protein